MFVSGHAMHTWAAMTWVRGRESLVTLGSIARAAREATEIGYQVEGTNNAATQAKTLKLEEIGPDAGQTNDRRYMYVYVHHRLPRKGRNRYMYVDSRSTCRSTYM